MADAIQFALSFITNAFSYSFKAAPIVAGVLALYYLFYRRAINLQKNYLRNLDWRVYEIKIPKDNVRTPKVMENVFASLYSMDISVHWEETWITTGKLNYRMSLEIAGSKDEGVRFYARAPKKLRNIIESSFFSQYPDAEIVETEDYTKELPPDLPNDEYNLFGVEFGLKNEDYFPIRTYTYFFEETARKEEESRIDPISVIVELMSNLKEGERLWMQVLITPSGNKWQNEGRKAISEMASGKEKKAKKNFIGSIVEESFHFIRNLIKAPFELPDWPEDKKEEQKTFRLYSPVETDRMKAVGNKISKRGYKTTIRTIYIDKKESYTTANAYALMGASRLYADDNSNWLVPAKAVWTMKPRFFFRKYLLRMRKKNIYKNYLKRSFPETRYFIHRDLYHLPILNFEELASIYHPPVSKIVGGTGLRPIKAVKGAPPPNLPIE
jgi:hypothetical protein